ncbi:hypothetical protein DFS34DRAFT_184321 [Phlyctochytrium arcticum]|nr:hypothetical protein DFS34DRAFT_184321 [Phlyctochytrium arcticum]
MLALDHPILHLSLKIAVGVACTVATGVAFTYGLQYLIRDHNATALRRELRIQKKRALDVLRGIERECKEQVIPRIGDVRDRIGGPSLPKLGGSMLAPAAEALSMSSDDEVVRVSGAFSRLSRTPSTSPERLDKLSSTLHGSYIAVASAPPSPSSQSSYSIPNSPYVPAMSSPLAHNSHSLRSSPPLSPSSSISSSSPVTASTKSLTERSLREIDDHLLRLLEQLDAVQPQDIPASLSSLDMSSIDTDGAIANLVDQAMDSVRARKRMLVNRLQKQLDEIDRLCAVAGIDSVGDQHARGRLHASKNF